MPVSLKCERHELEFLKAQCKGLRAQLKVQPKAFRARRNVEVECLQEVLEESYRVQSEQERRLEMLEANNITANKQIEEATRKRNENHLQFLEALESSENLHEEIIGLKALVDVKDSKLEHMQKSIDSKACVHIAFDEISELVGAVKKNILKSDLENLVENIREAMLRTKKDI